tara:strand:- start:153 stop:845 length:693 start_codon:yes stop_codon:yes gene_type:complete
MRIWAVIPAAGVGKRFSSDIPKQYLPLSGIPVLLHSINKLLKFGGFEEILVTLNPADTFWQKLNFTHPKVKTIHGGFERCNSVNSALEDLSDRAENADWVLVHDAVRPCISDSDLKKITDIVHDEDVGGLLACPILDTIKEVDENLDVQKTIPREKLWSAMTPQIFRYELLKQALEAALVAGRSVTDEASAIESIGLTPRIVQGDKTNIKVTHSTDMVLAESIINTLLSK